MKLARAVAWCLAGAAWSTVASAQPVQAFVAEPAHLRAGSAPDYPAVAVLPRGGPVTVVGCLGDYTWCDVALPNLRGWVYARLLLYPYRGNSVPLLSYGTAIGVPVVPFSISPYWGAHYRNKPWFHTLPHWSHRPPHAPYPGGHWRPPGPPHPGARPPGHPGHGGGGHHGGGHGNRHGHGQGHGQGHGEGHGHGGPAHR